MKLALMSSTLLCDKMREEEQGYWASQKLRPASGRQGYEDSSIRKVGSFAGNARRYQMNGRSGFGSQYFQPTLFSGPRFGSSKSTQKYKPLYRQIPGMKLTRNLARRHYSWM